MSVAFGVPQAADGTGTTAQDMRRILAAMYPSRGVVSGLAVKGDTSLSYRVEPGVAVTSRGPSDGNTLSWFAGGKTPAVVANASGSPRIDSVWVTAHDATQGDPDNLVVVGVTQGTPASAPVAPKAPSHATELARMLVPAGATTTANATMAATVAYAVPYGASQGVLIDSTYTGYEALRESPFTFATGTLSLATDRLLSIDLTTSVWAYDPKTLDWLGSGYVDWTLDGEVQRAFRFLCYPGTCSCQTFTDVKSVPAGDHVIQARLWPSGSEPKSGLWLDYAPGSWPGQRLVVTDVGVSA